jgi:uncharacterized membrane protein
MFIDYVSLMLINMVAGLVLLAADVARGLDRPDRQQWIPGCEMTGSIALATGLPMVLTWPVGVASILLLVKIHFYLGLYFSQLDLLHGIL